MSQISARELYELYLDTIARCNRDLLKRSDEQIEHELFEEFDVGAHSFLHEDNLLKLRDAGFIDDTTVSLSKEEREKWLSLQNAPRNAAAVRADGQWKELFDLCERAGKLNSRRDQKLLARN